MMSPLRVFILASAILDLSACATTARMHTEAELNNVTQQCGLALGELIQDESEVKLLLAIRQTATAEQRACVARWARRNGLKAVFVNMRFPS
jgi:sensor histidine kinase regulating citrate/malate metabolism